METPPTLSLALLALCAVAACKNNPPPTAAEAPPVAEQPPPVNHGFGPDRSPTTSPST